LVWLELPLVCDAYGLLWHLFTINLKENMNSNVYHHDNMQLWGGGGRWGFVLYIMLMSCWLIILVVGPRELLVLLVDSGVTPPIGLKINNMPMQINNP
jgi:hypothetical protein